MEESSKQTTFGKVIKLFVGITLVILGGFLLQGYFSGTGTVEWFRLPASSDSDLLTPHIGWMWHSIGFVGLLLFSSRFWVQWWNAEQLHTSHLGPMFWWLSLVGGMLTLVYFIRIDDPVNIVGPAFGLLPYIRNLILLRKTARQQPLTVGASP
jgi:lipid-A-disaccharide synthase